MPHRSCALTSTRHVNRNSTMSWCPSAAARCSAPRPSQFLALTLAPMSIISVRNERMSPIAATLHILSPWLLSSCDMLPPKSRARWRRSRGERPCAAGTSVEKMSRRHGCDEECRSCFVLQCLNTSHNRVSPSRNTSHVKRINTRHVFSTCHVKRTRHESQRRYSVRMNCT